MGFLGDFGGRCEDVWWESTHPQNCVFSDIAGPDLNGYSHLP